MSVAFSLPLVITLLTSYYCFSFDMTTILIPILLLSGCLLQDAGMPRWTRAIFLIAVAVLSFSPLFWFLVLSTGQFYWVGFSLLLLLSIALAAMMQHWKATRQAVA